MTVDAIGAFSPSIAGVLPTSSSPVASGSPAADFGQLLGDGLGRLDASVKSAESGLRAMAAGQDVPVHDVMISLEQARMQLMFMVEVRNRVVEAYQELMRMQL
ncbi:flagellar hook-basal body complex protein FliE [Thermomonas sp.]|uniref:flagellar hook-basal body complex protein FliE n=1 Tax=Thermomonas sp. TaxID=1971895 RepID=UPI002C9EB2F9|nr:flagellar hook-basal body complex protein FliE [Thermomonas sp.]HRO63593.1 flagellar hook-basal body complex protein FliE [Thermomonas sp.]